MIKCALCAMSGGNLISIAYYLFSFTLRGASCLVLPCSLSMCFFCPFNILITLLGEEGAGLCAYNAFVY